jgi:hypothetical protein
MFMVSRTAIQNCTPNRMAILALGNSNTWLFHRPIHKAADISSSARARVFNFQRRRCGIFVAMDGKKSQAP